MGGGEGGRGGSVIRMLLFAILFGSAVTGVQFGIFHRKCTCNYNYYILLMNDVIVCECFIHSEFYMQMSLYNVHDFIYCRNTI